MSTTSRVFLLGAALCALHGCATSVVPPESAEQAPSNRVLSYQKPIQDGSKLIVVRDSGFMGGGCYATVYLNGTRAAELDTGEKVVFNIPPGEWMVGAALEGKALCGSNPARKEREVLVSTNQSKVMRIFTAPDYGLDILPTSVSTKELASNHTSTELESWKFNPIEINYNNTRSPIWNFANSLNSTAGICYQYSSAARLLHKNQDKPTDQLDEYDLAFIECLKFAHQKSNEAVDQLKSTNPSPKLMELSKELYASWNTYLANMGGNSPENNQAKLKFETAREAILTEDRFSK